MKMGLHFHLTTVLGLLQFRIAPSMEIRGKTEPGAKVVLMEGAHQQEANRMESLLHDPV